MCKPYHLRLIIDRAAHLQELKVAFLNNNSLKG